MVYQTKTLAEIMFPTLMSGLADWQIAVAPLIGSWFHRFR
jgi:hypothetical protein